MLLKNAFQNNFDMFGKWTDELECIVNKKTEDPRGRNQNAKFEHVSKR